MEILNHSLVSPLTPPTGHPDFDNIRDKGAPYLTLPTKNQTPGWIGKSYDLAYHLRLEMAKSNAAVTAVRGKRRPHDHSSTTHNVIVGTFYTLILDISETGWEWNDGGPHITA